MSKSPSFTASLPSLGRLGQRFWPHLRKQHWLIVLSVLAMFAEIGLRLLMPWPLKFIFDAILVVDPDKAPAIPAILQGFSSLTLMTLAAVAVVVIGGLNAAVAYANQVGMALVGNRVLTEIRGEVYRHLQRLSLSFHTKTKSGDLIARLISDMGRLQQILVTAILPLLVNFLTFASMLGMMLWLNWELTSVALLAFPLFGLTMVRLSKRIQHVAREQRKREGAMAANAAEAISSIKIIQALSLERVFEHMFAKQNKKSFSQGAKAKRLAANMERTTDIVVALSTAIVLWYGARLALKGMITPGDLLVFIAYLKSTLKPIRDLSKYTGRIAKAAASGERILDVLDTEPDIRDEPGARPAPPFRGEIRFENCSFGYKPGHPILENINFVVRPGQQVALVGPSGTGKSTLLNLLLRLYDPTEGRVIIDGRDIRQYKLDSLRAQFGVVLQDNMLFGVSVRDNIAYGKPRVSEAEIKVAAHLANAHSFIINLPNGYDTILGERGGTLSGGQRQRIAIARAIVRRAPIVILDEPTTGLDGKNEQIVLKALEQLTQDRTTFIITHNLPTIEQVDLILYIENGRIVERGTHPELMRLGDRYATLYATQSAQHKGQAHQKRSRPNSTNGQGRLEVSYAFSG